MIGIKAINLTAYNAVCKILSKEQIDYIVMSENNTFLAEMPYPTTSEPLRILLKLGWIEIVTGN